MKHIFFAGRLIAYFFIFFFELILANIQIVRLVLSPGLRFRSVAVNFHSKMKTRLELLLITNSITLTPGTLVMDADLNTGLVAVHSMSGESIEKVRQDLGRFPEEKVLWVTRGKEGNLQNKE